MSNLNYITEKISKIKIKDDMDISDDDNEYIIESEDESVSDCSYYSSSGDSLRSSEQEVDKKSGEVDYEYCVLSIDIGIIHLGISVSLLDKEYNLIDIIWIHLINITEFQHPKGITHKNCNLYHTKTFCDWLEHVFRDNFDFFDMSDFILIERQPPMGIVAVEQLIFSKWRSKSILISPNSMHKFFNIGGCDYEKRKEYVVKIAKIKITDKVLLEQLSWYGREHDIADSICLMLFWIKKKQEEYKKNERQKLINSRLMNISVNGLKMTQAQWFDIHKYIQK